MLLPITLQGVVVGIGVVVVVDKSQHVNSVPMEVVFRLS